MRFLRRAFQTLELCMPTSTTVTCALCIVLTDTYSESVGPASCFRWSAARRCRHVCYLHWAHVHTHLHRQTPQVCHLVSDLCPIALRRPPVTTCPFICLLFDYEYVSGRWAVARIPLTPFSPAARLCELMFSSATWYANSPPIDSGNPACSMGSLCHLTCLA